MMGFCPMGYACRLANRAVIPTLTPEDLTDIDAARIGLKTKRLTTFAYAIHRIIQAIRMIDPSAD